MSQPDRTAQLDRPTLLGNEVAATAADPGRFIAERTAAALIPSETGLPHWGWLGTARLGLDAADIAAVRQHGTNPPTNQGNEPRSVSVLGEVSRFWFGRPGLEGHRLGSAPAAGHDWSTAFELTGAEIDPRGLSVLTSRDDARGLQLRTEIESVAGGPLRVRHQLTNLLVEPFLINHLDVALPIDDRVAEVLDLTGRWGRERSPQRHRITDGLYVRDVRAGRPNFESPTQLVAGTVGFGFGHGQVWGVAVAWSGNTTSYLERQPSGIVTLGGGELLLPGEIVLGQGESYSTPWVFFTASAHGLDGLAAQNHAYVRSLAAHPSTPRPVVCNVWEAVYFDHDLDRLKELADRAAEIGIERFVLDDGWFGSRRDDTSGLGDWTVSTDVWPEGLAPIIEHVRDKGMQFGLWFEPEMVNPDSELYRAHPDWVLQIAGREPVQSRNQLVLDLGRPEVRQYLFDHISGVLSAYPIEFVKWDHNRPLADAGSGRRSDTAGVHDATLGFYQLLDELRAAHPGVEWESCASGGGRIDLGVIERAERFWTSDMTDALSRQLIQRWTGQLVPPEYLGAHVSAPTNHQTGRQLPLDFRCATAFFGSFGVEWDVTAAGPEDRERLAGWISAYREHRGLLHSGRAFRGDLDDETRFVYGVVSADADEAIVAYAQLDDTVAEPGPFLVPGLDPARRYRARQIMADPSDRGKDIRSGWRGEGLSFTGASLAEVGLPAPFRGPETSVVVHLSAD